MVQSSYILVTLTALLFLIPPVLSDDPEDPFQPYYNTYSEAIMSCAARCNGESTCLDECNNRARSALCNSVVAALAGNGNCEIASSGGSWAGYCAGENCVNSPSDCACPTGYTCDPLADTAGHPSWYSGVPRNCVYDEVGTCGDGMCNGIYEGAENCASCPSDCNCFEDTTSYKCRPDHPDADMLGCVIIIGGGAEPRCGDSTCDPTEDCIDCEADCGCDVLGKVCDPSSERRDTRLCAPKMAYFFVSDGLSSYHRWWTADDQEMIRDKYSSLGYTLAPTMDVGHINDIATYLSRPSTKAVAYFGHGEEPEAGKTKSIPTMESAQATTGGYSIKRAIAAMTNQSKGFRYVCQYENYVSKFTGANKDKINQMADKQIEGPELDYLFMFACYSFDDTSLMDYLVKSGGAFWGYQGKLPGNAELTPAVKI